MNTLRIMITLKKILLRIVTPIVKTLGKFYMPYSHKKFKGKDYYEIRDSIAVGVGILTTTRGEVSNILNSSRPKHGALYVGGEVVKYVVEALGSGVAKTDLVSFLMAKDDVIIIRPKFATASEMETVARYAHVLIGKPYDFSFDPDNEAYYCFELLINAYQHHFPGVKFKSREVLGVQTYVAQDILADTDNWEIIYDNRS